MQGYRSERRLAPLAYRRPGPIGAFYIRAKEAVAFWLQAQEDRRRDRAARRIKSWIDRSPGELRLNTAIKFCAATSGDYPVAKELAEWVLARRDCSAEMVLFYLGNLGAHRFAADGWTEENLREDAVWFAFVDQLISGLRSGRYAWRGAFRTDSRETIPAPVEAWRDVPSLQYCDLYEEIETEQPPNSILDAYERLGAYSGQRAGRYARALVARKVKP